MCQILQVMARRMKLYNDKAFTAQHWCPMEFYGLGFDWLPFGQQSSAWTPAHWCKEARTGPLNAPGMHSEGSTVNRLHSPLTLVGVCTEKERGCQQISDSATHCAGMHDTSKLSVEIPRLRWLLMEQNPADFSKLNSILAEALAVFGIVLSWRFLGCPHVIDRDRPHVIDCWYGE